MTGMESSQDMGQAGSCQKREDIKSRQIAERKIGESAGIAAYRNGYAVYHAGRDTTVFRIHYS